MIPDLGIVQGLVSKVELPEINPMESGQPSGKGHCWWADGQMDGWVVGEE